MKQLIYWLGAVIALIMFMVLDGVIYLCAYNLGFTPFVNAFDIHLPDIGIEVFILFAGMLHIFRKGDKQYSVTDKEGWGYIISNYLTKFFIILVLLFIHLIFTL